MGFNSGFKGLSTSNAPIEILKLSKNCLRRILNKDKWSEREGFGIHKMDHRRPGGTGECWRRQLQLAGIMQSSRGKYYAIVCNEMILGRGPYEMASLSNFVIAKRDVINGLVFVIYREPMFIDNLFSYTF